MAAKKSARGGSGVPHVCGCRRPASTPPSARCSCGQLRRRRRGRRRRPRRARGRAARARRCGARRRAASPAASVRRTLWSSLIGFSSTHEAPRAGRRAARRSRSASPGSVKLQPTISYRPRPTSASSARRRRRCSVAQPPGAAAALGQRGGQLLEAVDARDLLDEVGLARDVVAPEGGHQHVEAAGRLLDGEAQRAQDLGLARARDRQRRGSPATRCSRRRMTCRRRAVAADVDRPGHQARAGQLEHEPRGDDLRPPAPARARGPSRSARWPRCAGPGAARCGGCSGRPSWRPPSARASCPSWTSERSPPMTPAIEVGPSASSMTSISRVERAHLAVERGDLLAVAARGARRAARRRRGRGRRRAAAGRRAASRSW